MTVCAKEGAIGKLVTAHQFLNPHTLLSRVYIQGISERDVYHRSSAHQSPGKRVTGRVLVPLVFDPPGDL